MARDSLPEVDVDGALARAWVAGWSVSRGASPALERDGALILDVGLTTQVSRYVIPEPDEAQVRKLTASITAPATWIKTFVDAETLRPWIADGTAWEFTNPGFLMSVPLGGNEPVDAPAGYQLRIWRHGGLTRGLIVSADGSFAARAQTGEARHLAVAVFDQVETAPEHRRRGLGSVLMRALAAEAAQRGARLGVLGATPEGRRLYESLGWTVAAPLTSLILDPAHASAS